MSIVQILGLVLLAVGVVLLIIAGSAADSFSEEFRHAFTGEYSESTTWYIIGGVALTVGGLALLLFGKRAART